MPLATDDADAKKKKEVVYFANHGKLELLINPSERDHRALIALIRHIYGYPRVEIDMIARQRLGIAGLDPSATQLLLQPADLRA